VVLASNSFDGNSLRNDVANKYYGEHLVTLWREPPKTCELPGSRLGSSFVHLDLLDSRTRNLLQVRDQVNSL